MSEALKQHPEFVEIAFDENGMTGFAQYEIYTKECNVGGHGNPCYVRADIYHGSTDIADELAEAAEAVAKSLEFELNEQGGCDHSAGICMCGPWAEIERLRTALAEYKEQSNEQ